ncbi:MAG: cytochrome C [Hydrogenophilales bacterium CG17_big_fil_post_rev_8_21_14_2_50_63_12]|nr:MAG: cytochrome C [Hydrogenophilales bacterium CG17_big_fil_post_rev_8_21_14_2_50_63_12]PIX96639.1 MAG: cytochrome C [Hydrogenophilales bacterium CG_4_10_14_3_um_filter_63_21]
MNSFNRRNFIKAAIAAAPASAFLTLPQTAHAGKKASVVVVGGGYGGATAAKYLKLMDPALDVTLVERNPIYTSCPLSNEVISGHGKIEDLQIGYDGLKKRGINVLFDDATGIDAAKKTVSLKGGKTLNYDALVVSPGVDFNYTAVEGYSEALANSSHPHAWKAGAQTLALKKKLEGMQDGQTFVLSVPKGPFRCPPGPYERASQVASYFKHHGMNKCKVIIADANDSFSKKGLFEQAWARQYPGMIEWVSGANGGQVVKFDAASNTASSDFNAYKGDVVNIIPPHHAGAIAKHAGLTNDKGWCPVDMLTMESTLHKDVYVVGDACVHGDLPVYAAPKSAHSAATQAKVAVGAIIAKLHGLPAPEPFFVNTCYSITAPGWGFSVVHVYRVKDGKLVYIKEAGGISPVKMASEEQLVLQRKLEAEYAIGWLKNIMADAFA